MKTHRIIIFLLLQCLATVGYAQLLSLRLANKHYANMRYIDAVPLYEHVLKKHPGNREARIKLADAYRRIEDVRNAGRLYAELAHEDHPAPENVWRYAESLAQQGKYQEAATWYRTYSALVPGDARGKKFTQAYDNWSVFFEDSTQYKIRYVPSLNTWQSDFSPVFYKNGIVFCSARHQGTVTQSSYGYDHSPFLNLYMAFDTMSLRTELNNMSHPVTYTASTRRHHNHDYSSATANDSKIPADFGDSFRFDSTQYTFNKLTIIRPLYKISPKPIHEGPATFFHGQDTMLITLNESKRGTSKKTNKLGIYMASRQGSGWSEYKRLPFNAKGFSSAHPSLTPDNKKLYFASDRPGGQGGTDIYVIDYDNGVWSQPVNVTQINTMGNEVFPYAGPDGNLYFASDGHPGLGGLDLFRADIVDGKVTSIKNMGAPINSSLDDFGMLYDPNNRNGFISSNRKRGLTDDDIYAFERTCEPVRIFVVDSITRKPIAGANVSIGNQQAKSNQLGIAEFCVLHHERKIIVSLNTYDTYTKLAGSPQLEVAMKPFHYAVEGTVRHEEDKMLMEGVHITITNLDDRKTREFVTDKTGKYNFPLEANRPYRIVATKPGCGTNTSTINTLDRTTSATLENNFIMLCEGDIIKVDNIYYDLNKATIRSDAAKELDKLAEVMWKYPDMRIELRSHTDSRSSATTNMQLSAKRAQAAVDYLTGKGIIPSRMRAAGYGESVPINKCIDGVSCTEEEYQQNRRTEFKVLSIK